MLRQLTVKRLVQIFILTIGFILLFTFIATGTFLLLPSSSLYSLEEKQSLVQTQSENLMKDESASFKLDTMPERYLKLFEAKKRSSAASTKQKRLENVSSERFIDYSNCNMHNCFDIYRCPFTGQHKLTVYVYPFEKFIIGGKPTNLPMSKEFYYLISLIVNSTFYVSDPSKACVFIPTIDLFNLQRTFKSVSSSELSLILQSLEFWGKDGQNHLLLTLSADNEALFNVSQAAMVAAPVFPDYIRQVEFKIPWLFMNPLLKSSKDFISQPSSSIKSFQKYNLISLRSRKLIPKTAQNITKSILFLDYCNHDSLNYNVRCISSHSNVQEFNYPEILSKFDFCLVNQLIYPSLWDIMSVGCIPVIILEQSTLSLPFDELIDWKRNAILVNEKQFNELFKTLKKVSPERKKQLKSQISFTFQHYLKSVDSVVNTLLTLLKQRAFSYSPRLKSAWNSLKSSSTESMQLDPPILNPMIANKRQGFTTVILAYERVKSLFQVIDGLDKVPSLAKIIVVWNNQDKPPPPAHLWPNITKPIKVIQTKENLLSNRFFPYQEITTEAVFSLDDDIIMLTPDEIEFGFQTWVEFSDRIVGYPSRTTIWDNSTRKWKYESEWTNQVSMVLTGAAFYHKYYHHSYTYEMPRDIFDWVDSKRNCEDIAMNFLIAHHTKKSPLKVTPRKKFKCPNCVNNEMLSADSSHMIARTDCINKFEQIYGYMPLIPVEFRVDPVLFKVDGLPKKVKAFGEIGSL